LSILENYSNIFLEGMARITKSPSKCTLIPNQDWNPGHGHIADTLQ